MGLDIRIPMGVMFGLLGLIITIYGVISPKEIYNTHSLGININLWWGLAMVAFALVMLLLAGRKKAVPPAPSERGDAGRARGH